PKPGRAPTERERSSPPASPAADAQRAETLTKQGMRALVQGKLRDAVSDLRGATRLAPNSPRAWRSLGLAYERLRRRAQAAHAYRRYLQLAPSAPDAATVRSRLRAL
ncbi:MAG: tetratricopeptide repeat protein, partial [Myxococcales bacterium]|nr:tetratricopeptide repeat protein [Myxococcales bacterium]